MALAIRLIAATTVLLTATAFGWLAHDEVGTPILSAGLATVAGVPVLALLLGWMAAGKSAPAEIGSGKRERTTAELAKSTAALAAERNKRRTTELALEQYEQRERMFSAAVEQASYPIITKTLDGTITGGIRRRSGSTGTRRRRRSAAISTSSFRLIAATSIQP